MTQLNEVFESEGTLPTVNLNPKLKVPQIWKIGGVESQLVARMVSYSSEGDAIKQVKLGDKYAHVILMSLSAKGAPAELKGGLGATPIDAINTIFDVVYEQVKKLRMDAVMFRFPTKKMKGQGPIVQRLIQRLVAQKTGGRFKVVPAMYEFTGKHTYILVVRKQANIEDIKGIPEINAELYTKVDSDVGDVYVSKKEGVQVTKETAIAGSIAKVEERRTDKTVITKTKISRRAIAMSQSLESARFETPMFTKFEASASELSKPATAPLIPQSNELSTISTASFSLESVLNTVTNINGVGDAFADSGIVTKSKIKEVDHDVKVRAFQKIHGKPITSMDALSSFASVLNEVLEEYKGAWLGKFFAKHSNLDYTVAMELSESSWNVAKTKVIKKEIRGFALAAGWTMFSIVDNRDETQYTPAQKRGIREYVGSGYEDMNNALLGIYNPEVRSSILTGPEIEKAIDNLDDAFKNGDRLPEGITLYRSQKMIPPIYEAMVKNKVFYFRNFVSTSLYPNIFGTWMTDASVGTLPDEVRLDVSIDKSDEGLVKSNDDQVGIGWAISGAHKINVVFPGAGLAPSNEMEIILPRGLMLKINKITDASYNDGTSKTNNKLVQAEVMTSDELQESVVYDGNMLMETGELVVYQDDFDTTENPVSFDSFVKSTKFDVLPLLASCMNLNDMPEKFIQG
ncbi:putative ADP-ribosyltransferase [Escherichia phage vb_EcoM-VR5]|uniref:NAD(+)--arginine ADP-ribosyltransferase n=1 Tax=Escherichia phage vb_EcoM-VR5 TaxID=1567026 RepID=A0A0A7HEW2_9CAUD|nr:Alt-like RNA polymerase ADP-ribosyltransferase [Escherichia phage vb_EcoM-VR5]AIZ01985.1 putative ADP-ribosyltransferase [Escherichia phage vb_EcoM-VR5]